MARPKRPDNAPRAFTRVFQRGQETLVEQTEETPFREEQFVPPFVEDWEDPKALQKVITDLYATLLRFQDAVREATAGVRSLPPWTTIQGVVLAAGVNTVVPHRLGRAYRGWRAVRARDGYPQVTEVANASTDLDRLQLTVVAYSDVTVDIEVW